MSNELSGERAAFEAYSQSPDGEYDSSDFGRIASTGEYANQNLDHDWVVWQAAIAHKSEGAEKLQHVAVSEGGVLRWMSGRKLENCELYAKAATAAPVAAPVVAIPEGCTPADAKMLREANHALAAENDDLRRALGSFARLVSTDKLSWAMVEYQIEGDPEKQTFQRPQMQREFNRAAEVLRDKATPVPAGPAADGGFCADCEWSAQAGGGKCEGCAPAPHSGEAVTGSWRPIATAPKDGTHVDLYEVSIFGGKRYPDCLYICDGWSEYAEGHYRRVSGTITHWMPVPAKPGEIAKQAPIGEAGGVVAVGQKSVATVRVKHKGYAMELSTYVAYALPEGLHELYAAQSQAAPSELSDAQLIEICKEAGIDWQDGGRCGNGMYSTGSFERASMSELRAIVAAASATGSGA